METRPSRWSNLNGVAKDVDTFLRSPLLYLNNINARRYCSSLPYDMRS